MYAMIRPSAANRHFSDPETKIRLSGSQVFVVYWGEPFGTSGLLLSSIQTPGTPVPPGPGGAPLAGAVLLLIGEPAHPGANTEVANAPARGTERVESNMGERFSNLRAKVVGTRDSWKNSSAAGARSC